MTSTVEHMGDKKPTKLEPEMIDELIHVVTYKSPHDFEFVAIPRDRNGEFEPQIITKHQRNITGIEDKILSLYTAGLSTRDIHDQIQELYDVEISSEMVSKITDRVLPLVTEWQHRPLE